MDVECYIEGCNCNDRNPLRDVPHYEGLSDADVRMVEYAATNSQTYCRTEIIRPSDEAIQAYKDAHPEVDWDTHEVLYTWQGFGSPMTVESHWSHKDRDEIYDALIEVGLDPKWFEKAQEAQ